MSDSTDPSNGPLAVLSAGAAALARAADLDTALAVIVEAGATAVGASQAAVFGQDPERTELELLETLGMDDAAVAALEAAVAGDPGHPIRRAALDRTGSLGRGDLAPDGGAMTVADLPLVVAIVHNEDAGALVDALLERDFRATRLHSSGGFLKQSNATVMLGVEDDEVDEVMAIVRESCHSRTQIVNPMPPIMEPGEFFMPYPLEVEVGGATVFVLPVERFERL